MRYAVVIEKAGKGFSGYVPDLPGCVAAASTLEGVKRELAQAIPFHLDGLREAGTRGDPPQSVVEWVEV